MSNSTSRRDFLKLSTLAAVGLTVAPRSWGQKPKSPSDRIRFASIGVGGKGWSGTEWAAKCGDIVAICDVDANTLDQSAEVYPKAAKHRDYRKMIEDHAKDFDAVVISTPDHHHFYASALAMHQGKHVYCEKPLTKSIWEARELQKLARRKRLSTQMGNQGSSSTPMRKAAAAIRSGALGKVKEVHVWTDRAAGWWPQGVPRPASKTPPAHVDWDVWLGPSVERDFAEGVYHSFAWRGWWDFGTGSLGDIACHAMNVVYRAVDIRNPIAVTAKTSGHNRDSFPLWSIITYEYAKTRERDAFTMTWYDGGKKPPAELAPGVTLGGNGKIIVCEKGTVYASDDYDYRLLGGTLPDVAVEESPGHMEELARAIQGGPAPMSNFIDYAGPLSEVVLLGNLAVWADGPRVPWDARRMRVPGTRDYEALIKPTYRKGWTL